MSSEARGYTSLGDEVTVGCDCQTRVLGMELSYSARAANVTTELSISLAPSIGVILIVNLVINVVIYIMGIEHVLGHFIIHFFLRRGGGLVFSLKF